MPRRARPYVTCIAAAVCAAATSAAASSFGLFQHGGRATGQVGAFVARADDPAAIAYNPAGLVRTSGLELLGGVDFAAPRDDFDGGLAGDFAAKHQINLTPALYLTWKSARPGPALAFGVGIDAAMWSTTYWLPVAFPDAERARRFEVRLFEVHPAAAYELSQRWSVGGGVRYLFGDLKEGRAVLLAAGADPNPYATFGEKLAEADVDGWGFDLGVQYSDVAFGVGAVLRSGADVEGQSDVVVEVRDFVRPQDQADVDAIVRAERAAPGDQFFELPPELRLGGWMAPYPELRLELDLILQLWSRTDNATQIPLACLTQPCGTLARDWDDTVSLRLGVEGDLTDAVALYGGLAWEPSPVPDTTREPGAPRGDALVYAIGVTYTFPQLSFDLGYSLHDHERVGGELASGRYSARDQVFAGSARWRF